MTERPLPPVWGQGLYAAADGLGEWVRRSGYEPCHAKQRGWLACEWHERTIDDAGLPPRLVLVWDARSAALEWLGLATPVRRGGSGGGAEFGLQRRGPVLIPAPPAPDGPTEPDERCPRHSKLTTGDIWAVLTLDLPTTSPHALQTALLRLGQTWADLREPVVEQQHWWQSLDERYDDFPELPWWVQDVARANESQRVRVFRGTAGIYWNFNDFQGRWRADHADWVKWVESEEVSDHATYYRWGTGGGTFTGTYGWASFYIASPTLEAAGEQRDAAARRVMELLQLAGKGAPRWHQFGEGWVRPLTVVVDRAAGQVQVRCRRLDDRVHAVNQPGTDRLTELLADKPGAEGYLLERVQAVLEDWRVH